MLLIAAAGTALLIVLLKFGTINPCGIVREQVRREGGVLTSLLPDAVIDALIAGQNGPLSPARCMTLAFTKVPIQTPPQPRPSEPVRNKRTGSTSFLHRRTPLKCCGKLAFKLAQLSLGA
jgi:hypothetical protein